MLRRVRLRCIARVLFFRRVAYTLGWLIPGVGSDRRGIVVETERFAYVGPDNGLFSAVYEREVVRRIVAIENAALMRPQVSSTFHGRDVFAQVGAHLLKGVSCDEVGPEIEDPVTCDLWGVEERDDALVGRVVCVDHFGNAISMIARSQVDAKYPDGILRLALARPGLIGYARRIARSKRETRWLFTAVWIRWRSRFVGVAQARRSV